MENKRICANLLEKLAWTGNPSPKQETVSWTEKTNLWKLFILSLLNWRQIQKIQFWQWKSLWGGFSNRFWNLYTSNYRGLRKKKLDVTILLQMKIHSYPLSSIVFLLLVVFHGWAMLFNAWRGVSLPILDAGVFENYGNFCHKMPHFSTFLSKN